MDLGEPGWILMASRRCPGLQSQDCIVAALACSKILKALSQEEKDTDTSEEMQALAREFEHRAIGEPAPGLGTRVPPHAARPALTWSPHAPGVFTECYRKDEERAQKLLIRVSEGWGKTTCLQLALEAKAMKFVSHGGIQVLSQPACAWAPCSVCVGGAHGLSSHMPGVGVTCVTA